MLKQSEHYLLEDLFRAIADFRASETEDEKVKHLETIRFRSFTLWNESEDLLKDYCLKTYTPSGKELKVNSLLTKFFYGFSTVSIAYGLLAGENYILYLSMCLVVFLYFVLDIRKPNRENTFRKRYEKLRY